MKAVRKWVDKFCYKHPKFGVNNLMLYITGLFVLVYLISIMDRTGTFISFMEFDPYRIIRGEVWRIISWAFIPTSGFPWIVIELYFYYFIGSTLENAWGSGRFTIYYAMGIVLNIIYGLILSLAMGAPVYITAFYLNLSMFFAFAAMYPEQRVLVMFFIPVKVKWLAWIDAAFLVYRMLAACVAGSWAIAFLPLVAILNFFIFCGDELTYGFRRSGFGSVNSNTVNFKRESRKIKKAQAQQRTESGKPYRHKCAVCGRTDADYPNLEFRYCSRCAGYHCFCMDHINNHVHFTE